MRNFAFPSTGTIYPYDLGRRAERLGLRALGFARGQPKVLASLPIPRVSSTHLAVVVFLEGPAIIRREVEYNALGLLPASELRSEPRSASAETEVPLNEEAELVA